VEKINKSTMELYGFKVEADVNFSARAATAQSLVQSAATRTRKRSDPGDTRSQAYRSRSQRTCGIKGLKSISLKFEEVV
jgi:hypothetical protein